MRAITLILLLFALISSLSAQSIQDDFEGNGTINSWFGDDCNMNLSFSNPYVLGINTSSTVLRYQDYGGQYANVRFDVNNNFQLLNNHTFTIKIYVPSGSITGTQNNQVSLKLQDGTLASPWSTQSEIIKNIQLDQWQTLTFDFLNDNYINFDPNSLPPTQRLDFNRVLIQVNGENNFDQVIAYIDDLSYDGTIQVDPVYDQLIWSDEFDVDGAVDPSKWYHQTLLPNGNSWFNNEIQHYTDRLDNAYVQNGILYVNAKKETFTDQGVTKQYTSARLNSKFAFQYGKMVVRAKLPTGVGTWPAIWMLGKNITENGGYWNNQGFGTTGWPACGEIDVMEHWGNNQNYVQSATHTPSSFGATVNHGGQTLPDVSTAFHDYILEWYPDKLVFSVDSQVHYTYQPLVRDANTWPFDAEQYILLNVAILPTIDTAFTQDALEIDYVRVYQETITKVSGVKKNEDLKLFPNPIDDFLHLELPDNWTGKEIELKIYDVLGNQYYYQKNNLISKIQEIELSHLNKGLYFITASIEGQIHELKFIKY